jgi:formylglycine-generating enzyme required for sulfatase activity
MVGGDKNAYEGFNKQEVRIKYPYRLSCYPITNAQFQCFVEAPDWDDRRWWQDIPSDEQAFDEPYFPYANHPCERVSWYQAVAFCRWLSDKLGYVVELPHEYEWEVAARYPDGRFYPWGHEFEAGRANTVEGGVGQTTAVGLYSAGKHEALNLYDLSGNVWEWCRNKYDSPKDETIDQSRRVVRGGSWLAAQNFARAASRYYDPPVRLDLGFRVVVRRSPSQGH